jgi:hypothetical protein
MGGAPRVVRSHARGKQDQRRGGHSASYDGDRGADGGGHGQGTLGGCSMARHGRDTVGGDSSAQGGRVTARHDRDAASGSTREWDRRLCRRRRPRL